MADVGKPREAAQEGWIPEWDDALAKPVGGVDFSWDHEGDVVGEGEGKGGEGTKYYQQSNDTDNPLFHTLKHFTLLSNLI